jgi:hypothetical protein
LTDQSKSACTFSLTWPDNARHQQPTNNKPIKKLILTIALTALSHAAQAGWVFTGATYYDDGTIRTANGGIGRVYADGLVVFPGHTGSLRMYPNGRMYGTAGDIYQVTDGGFIYAIYCPQHGVY